MKDQYKTKTQLIEELEVLRKRVIKLEGLETERKRAEKALRESEERYRIITDCVDDVVWQLDLRLHFVYVSPAVERMLGYTTQEACGLYVVDLLDEDGLVRMREVIKNRSERKTDFSRPNEYRMRHKDGHWLDVEVLSSPLFDAEGHPTGFVGITRDIGMRKRAEEALRDAETKYRIVADNTYDWEFWRSPEGRFLYTSPSCKRITGHAPDEFIADPDLLYRIVHPDDRLDFDRHKDEMTQKIAPYEVEFRVIRPDGAVRWIGHACQPVFAPDGHFLGMRGSNRDITERKRVEEALRESEQKILVIAENVPALFAYVDTNGCYQFVNKRYEEWFEMPRAQVVGEHYKEVLGQTVYEQIQGFVEAALRGEEVNFEAPLPYVYGGTRWVLAKYVPHIDDQGKVNGFFALVTDITERKRAEEALRRKSGEQDLLLDNIQTQIWYLTDKETYGAVNKARANFFGKKKEEIENKKVYNLLDKDEAEICMSGYAEVFEKRKQIHTEEWIMKAKGEKRLLSIIKSPKLNENGDVEYVVCSAEDVTDRRRTEEEIHTYQEKLRSLSSELSLIEERERRRIATDLHDYIGQNLALTKMRLGALAELAISRDLSTLVGEIQTLIDQAIHYTRSLTSELSPPVLYELGFDAAVEWLIEQIQDQHHILVDFEDDRQSKPMSDEIRISLFKAVRELLTNIVKHAKVHKAKVSTRREDNIIRIIVEDDGVGFPIPEDKPFTQIGGFGLFSIRERLRHLGGNFEIESNPGQGTRVILVAPLTKEENNNRSVT